MKNEYLKDLADGFGSMNKVENKKNDKQPDYQGYFKADGKLFEIAGWVKVIPRNTLPKRSIAGSSRDLNSTK